MEDAGESVFPFKVFEYLTAGTHVIAPPIGSLEPLGLGFIQRWDGLCGSLPALLEGAQADYRDEHGQRSAAVEKLIDNYSLAGLQQGLASLLNGCNGT